MTAPLPLLAFASVIFDRIREADGTQHPPVAGGAGLYAAAAMAPWWPHVALVAGVGDDFDALGGGISARYGFDPRGLVVRDARSIQSLLTYGPGGERTEAPELGDAHFARLQLAPDDIDDGLLPAAGCYVFRDEDPAFWTAFHRRRDQFGIVLWELHADAARADRARAIGALLPMIDILSLNQAEADALLGARPAAAQVEALLAMGARTVLLRMGAKGALIAGQGALLRLRPPPGPVVDVTGGGNAFSGGFLAGWRRKPGDLTRAARCAAASAALAIARRGPPAPPDPEAIDALARAATIEHLRETMK